MAVDKSTQVFCPICRENAKQKDDAAFIEGGEYDELKKEYEWEGDVEVWQCQNPKCNQEFFM